MNTSLHLLFLSFCLISSFASGATLLQDEGMYFINVSLSLSLRPWSVLSSRFQVRFSLLVSVFRL